eukprot:14481078-Alexandrium_andersonii.AAC.1
MEPRRPPEGERPLTAQRLHRPPAQQLLPLSTQPHQGVVALQRHADILPQLGDGSGADVGLPRRVPSGERPRQ